MKSRSKLMGLLMGLCAMAAPAMAHHSAAMFDHTKELTVSGTVKEFQYTNPHAWLMVTEVDAAGKTNEWAIELGAPTFIQRFGILKSSFPVGEKVKVRLRPMKDGRMAGEFMSVERSDGKVFRGIGFGPPPGAAGGPPGAPPAGAPPAK